MSQDGQSPEARADGAQGARGGALGGGSAPEGRRGSLPLAGGNASDRRSRPRITALGGGHGLYATLSAVRRLTSEVTAVVTVADDGGSSGRLRQELDVIPPGDLRMALVALAPEGGGAEVWARVLQHRFGGGGALAGHPVGNLLLAGLAEALGDPVLALDEMARVFGVQGRVLPMSTVPLHIEAEVSGIEEDPRLIRRIRGQVAVATTPGKVRRVRLLPTEPPACAEAVAAIMRADMVVLGPGSWFSSVIPHVLVPEQLQALVATPARKVLVLNLAPEPGETAGFSTERHLHVLSQHAPGLRVDHVLVDGASVPDPVEREQLARAASRFGARPTFADVAVPGTHQHEAEALARALAELLGKEDVSGIRSSG